MGVTSKHTVTLYLHKRAPFDAAEIHGVVNALGGVWLNLTGATDVVTVEVPVDGTQTSRDAFDVVLDICRERLPHLDVLMGSVSDVGDLDDTSPPDLVGVAELAAMFGVSRQRASDLAHTPGFPRPLVVLASGPVWHRALVTPFARADWHRKPGRPPSSSKTKFLPTPA
jgi:hypothetical protein